ncbi:hypothetical protein Kpol_541p6 [Vanderwaltozyma polyspora DSM 70294]|uniref:Nucleoporin NUP188 n=1 Tax=Vanderwaltozyma polyspora (strain ATCC 22028 / DSM 70294 / BCRC 21397 / CBS 2163 / NBRC 10782 / NRRL Y-8283 / UCD 57-17) TaxID=436907 RepID=A7TIV1_VANPO|nr:uncharacterized protein Kpol_541p6 [Vanderwaltozyma polyspora DSM 70294]EDO17763.1 hypothetical protein Kpol_541p6 [Vanderwaltozyma polyspora DSM 70294]
MVLTFKQISDYIELFNADDHGVDKTFQLIEKYLLDNKNIITNISALHKLEKLEKAKDVKLLQLRNESYTITKIHNEKAFIISQLIKLDYDETLRILSQFKDSDCNDIVKSTSEVLKERNSIIDTILKILTDSELPVLGNRFSLYFATNKDTACNEVIKSLKFSIENFELTEDYSTLALSEDEYTKILQEKLSYDLIYITNLLRLFTILSLNSMLETSVVISWFEWVINSISFIENILQNKNNVPARIIEQIESLIVINSMLVLGLDNTDSSININAPYFNDPQTFKRLNQIFTQYSFNPVIIYMWTFVLYSKSFLLEENQDSEQSFANVVFKDVSIKSLIAHFASKAENNGALESIKIISRNLSSDKFFAAIICSFLTLALNFIPITIETSEVFKYVLLRSPIDYVEKFLTSEASENKITILKAKLPLVEEALLPLINLTAVNSEFAQYIWDELTTYTVKTKLGQLDYDLVDEGGYSETDLIVLKKEALIAPPLEYEKNALMPIPENTKAKILLTNHSDEQDVIVFLLKYSGWSLLGRLLQSMYELYSDKGNEINLVHKNAIISVIELISNLLKSEISIDKSTEILNSLQSNIESNDIVALICRIFDLALQKRSYKIICACSGFLNSLFKYYPDLVWSYLSRSSILDRYGKTGYATTILGSIELTSGEYDFTISLAKLANLLAEDSTSLGNNYPIRARLEILDKFTSHLLRVFEGYHFWKYADISQRFKIGLHTTTFFNAVVYDVYSIDPTSKPCDKITKSMFESSNHVINSFLSPHSPDVHAANALVKLLLSPKNKEMQLLSNKVYGNTYSRLIISSFEFAKTLLNTRTALQTQPSTFEKLLYESSSSLVEIYESNYRLKKYIINVLDTLIAAPWPEDYPFLLSYLGEVHSKNFLSSIISDLESSLVNYNITFNICKFISSLVESNQDGLTILFLTGEFLPKKSPKGTSDTASILNVLKKIALDIAVMPKLVACQLLEAIAYSLNSWKGVQNKGGDKEFIEALMKILSEFKHPVVNANISNTDMHKVSHGYKLISRIVEIFALFIYSDNDNSASIIEFLKKRDLISIVVPFFKIDGYDNLINTSLQTEFEAVWPGLKLKSFLLSPYFKNNTVLEHPDFNLYFMDNYFSSDENWQIFRNKLVRASLSMEFVTSKVSAAKALGALITSFVPKAGTSLNDTYIGLVKELLKVNFEETINSPLLAQISCERLELCFYLLFSLEKASVSIDEKTLSDILNQLMLLFKSNDVSFLDNISRSSNSNVYRPILRSILIILGMVKTKTHFIEMISDQFLEFFEWSFCKGGHLIFADILSDITICSAKGENVSIYSFSEKLQDLCLLLSIFSKLKSLGPSDDFNKIMASSLNDVGTLKVILNLYSSSHLFKIDDEPVLGSITLAFISELCSIEDIAQTFISNGLISVLLESPLSVAIQQGDLKLESHSRLHSIWSHGILTILLILLSKFGTKILAESILFVSYFSRQIKSTILSWSDSKLLISTALIRETSQLILLQQMLKILGYEDFISNSSTIQKFQNESIEVELVLGLDTVDDRRQLSLAFKHLLTHPKYLNSRVVPSTVEEQRILEDEELRNGFVSTITKSIQDLQESLFKEI